MNANKRVLITGAGTRLGLALAEALAEDGCDVILHAHRSWRGAETLAKNLRARGRTAKVLRADFSSEKETRRLAAQAWSAFGSGKNAGIDFLINNAAIYGPTSLENLDAGDLDKYYALNLKAPYLLCALLGRQMKARAQKSPKGHAPTIVNLACISAFNPWKNYLPYSISKAGVAALTVGFAKLLAPEVRVNAVAPGTVLPPPGLTKKEIARLAVAAPLKRVGSPHDVVQAVLFLLQAEFTTGQILSVDGGRGIG